jgi:hypothetical protein
LLTPAELERWLLEQGLAEPDGAHGLLRPTRLGVDLGGVFGFMG